MLEKVISGTMISFMKVSLTVFYIFITAFICQANPISVPDSIKSDFHAVRIEKPVNLSGKLDDPMWLKAIPVELKFEASPGENTPV